MKVTVVKVGKIYERNRWPYILTMPISWLMTFWVMVKKVIFRKICKLVGGKLPDRITNSIFFDHFAEKLRLIKEGSASWKALEIIYNHVFGQIKTLVGKLEDFWIGMMNAQSVRNRLKLIKIILRETLLKFGNKSKIMSLACGSAQAVLEVIAELKAEGINVQVCLVDISKEALQYARDLADKLGISTQVEILQLDIIRKTNRLPKDFDPDIIEMLGLLDYIPEKRAVGIFKQILDRLSPGGYFLTCNIRPNIEMYFLK